LLADVLSKIFEEPVTFAKSAESHVPFLPPKTAQDLLGNLEKLLPPPKSVVPTTSASVSPALRRVFDSAKALQRQFQHRQIQPLHLLAALLAEESSQGVKLLQDSGITREKVLRALGGPAEN
jgi:ATP-dependent Clp protease ATP-binding subunit ClpA